MERIDMETMMKQGNSRLTRGVVEACALLMILSVAPASFAQQSKQAQAQPKPQVAPASSAAATPADARPAAKPGAEEKEAAPTDDTGDGGIKIHGHWVLELKNPDGKVVNRREFNNSLVTGGNTTSGDQLIAALLSGNATAGGLGVAFISSASGNTTGLDISSFCWGAAAATGEPSVPTGIQCYALASANSILTYAAGQGLTSQFSAAQSGLTSVTSFSPSVNIVLSGNFIVQPAYSSLLANGIVGVGTYAGVCTEIPVVTYASGYRLTGSNLGFLQANSAPLFCAANATPPPFPFVIGALTYTDLPAGPMAVTAGQVITVTVTISFS
jgi:hypothetical protein